MVSEDKTLCLVADHEVVVGAAAAKVWEMLRKRGYFDPPAAR